MNNGVRVSIILAVVTVALLGLYYARLDDPVTSVVAVDEIPSSEIILESELDDDPGSLGDVEPDVVPPQDALEVPTPVEANSEPFEAPVDPQLEPEEPAGAADEGSDEASMEPDPLAPRELTAADGDSELGRASDEMDPGDALAAVPPSDVTAPEEDVPSSSEADSTSVSGDAADAGSPAVPATTASLGRIASAPGVGIHRIVGPEDPTVDLTNAMKNLAESSDADVVVDRASMTAWVSTQDDLPAAFADDLIIERKGDRSYLLVRMDEGAALRLDGRVSSARVVLEPDGVHHGVNFRIDPASIGEVSAESLKLVRVPIAWLQDGRVVLIERRPISINGQARISGGFDRENADRLASGLLSLPGLERIEAVPKSALGSAVGSASDDPGAGGTSASGNPGGLPADAYVEYEIKEGDYFEKIAQEWFGDRSRVSEIGLANPLLDPRRLQPGQIIRLPPKDAPRPVVVDPVLADGVRMHVVRSGETLSDIALAAYGKSSRWKEIYEANKDLIGADSGKLEPGMELVIP